MTEVKNILSNNKCCTKQQLLQYANNQLSNTDKWLIEEHFANCNLCSDAIDGLMQMQTNEDRNSLIENNIPFTTDNIQPLKIGYKKNNFLKIASGILLILGLGFGANQLFKTNQNKDEKQFAKVETQQQPNENLSINTPTKPKENFSPPAAPYDSDNVKTILSDKSKAEIVTDKKEVQTNTTPKLISEKPIQKPKLENNIVKNDNVVSEKKIASENKILNKTDESITQSTIASGAAESQKINAAPTYNNDKGNIILPAPINNNSYNNSKKYTANKLPTTTDVSSEKSIKTKTISAKLNTTKDEELKQGVATMDGKIESTEQLSTATLNQIKSNYTNKNYTQVISNASEFLQTKFGNGNTEAMYYLALSYKEIGDDILAKQWMENAKNGEGKFRKLAVKKLKKWK